MIGKVGPGTDADAAAAPGGLAFDETGVTWRIINEEMTHADS